MHIYKGYKISALDVEATVLAHPDVREAAVVGVADIDFGQRIVAVVQVHDVDGGDGDGEGGGCNVVGLTLTSLRKWCTARVRNKLALHATTRTVPIVWMPFLLGERTKKKEMHAGRVLVLYIVPQVDILTLDLLIITFGIALKHLPIFTGCKIQGAC